MTIFALSEFEPFADEWAARLNELERRQGYYDGSAYDSLFQDLSWFRGLIRDRLYAHVKPLYLLLSRAVDIDAGVIPAGWPLSTEATSNQVTAKKLLFAWSQWLTFGVLYIHYGASMGVVGLKVSDLRQDERIVIAPVDPTTFMLVEGGRYDFAPQMSIQVERRRDDEGEWFEKAEVITSETIRTYADGVLTEFDGLESERDNDLGFVPFVEVQHIMVGKSLGDSTYQNSMPLLDELNELSTYLTDIIRDHAEPQWAALGSDPVDLEKSGDNVWFFSRPDTKVQAIVASIDIGGVLEFVREIRDQVRGSLPELSFDDLAKRSSIATETVLLQLIELVIKVERVRPNYDAGLITALQMVGKAAKSMSLPSLAELDDEMLAMDATRKVLPIDLDVMENVSTREIEAEAMEE